MAGIRCRRTNKGAVLEIPTKNGIKKYATSLYVMRQFIEGKIFVLYFNDFGDFVKEDK